MQILRRYPSFFILVLLVSIAAILRLIFLDRIPTAIGGDELEYILNAKAFFLSGRDLTGTMSLFSVFFFQYPPGILPQAELPYFLTLPFSPLSLFSARVLYAFISVLIVPVMYLLTKELLDKRTALIVAFLTAVNPWMIFIGRTAYEATPAMFFYLLGIWTLLVLKGKNIFFSFPLFLLAFYSYIGTKVIFIPIIIAVSIFAYVRGGRKDKKYYITLSIISIVFVGLFVLLSQSGSRTSEILTPFSPSIAEEINSIRKTSIHTPFTAIFENKYVFYAKEVGDKLLSTLSFQYLFVSGDNFFAQWKHGLFYPVESLFLLIGLFLLVKKKKREFLFCITLMGISILPQLLHTNRSYFTPHITFFIPLLLLPIAYGLSTLVGMVKKDKLKRGGMIMVSLSYLFLILSFLNQYFTEYPLRGHLDFPTRVLSRLATISSVDQKVIVFTSKPQDLYKKHLFYTNAFSASSLPAIRNAILSKEYTIGNISFLSCGDIENKEYKESVIISDSNCDQNQSERIPLILPQLTDGGQVYRIYNDTKCSKYSLSRYPQNITWDSFSVESLSSQRFCETFITTL